jgi:glycosyltransferase involved in cell wall biosynthesis
VRILICNYEYPPIGGGGGIFTSLLGQELATKHEVTVLTSRVSGIPLDRFENGVRVIRVPVYFRKQLTVANLPSLITYIPMAIKGGEKLLKGNQYDLINTHFALPTGPVGDALARFAGIPNVLTLHGGDLYDPSKLTSPHRNPLLRTWIRRLLRRADVVVASSYDTLENMRLYYTSEIECIRIALGIKSSRLENVPRSRYGFGDDEVLLVTVGRLIARKALSQLIEVIESLKLENVRLLIIGTGPEDESLKQICSRMKLGHKIIFLGFLGEFEKLNILKICDLYVSTSQHEGFGLVFLEAMQSGLPIVCYDKGGQTDFLKNEETGYLIKLNDLSQFINHCRILIGNPNLRKKISAHNKLKAKEFDIHRCTALYEDLFNRTLTTFNAKKN